MDDKKVTQLPMQPNTEIDNFLLAAVEPSWFRICIQGKRIPRMLGRERGDKCEILFDDRWIYIFDSLQAAYTACSMAANALAIGQGYAWLGAANKDRPFAAGIMKIGD